MIAKGIIGLVGQMIGIFGETGKANQAALKNVADNMQRTWTDEILVLTFLSPFWVAWIDAEQASAWIGAISANEDYFALVVGITAAVFGLGKLGK